MGDPKNHDIDYIGMWNVVFLSSLNVNAYNHGRFSVVGCWDI